MKLQFLCVGLLALNCVSHAYSYHLANKVGLEGQQGWDYLIADADSRRVYVSHGDRVAVVDADAGKSAGAITDLSGVHGIALAPEAGRGYISCGKSGTVKIFDLKTLKSIKDVKVGKNPDAIIYDGASKRVFAFNGGSSDASVLETDGTVAATIALGGKPEYAAADGAGHVFVNLEDKDTVVELDSKAATVLATWPLGPGKEPSAMAIDPEGGRLYVGCHNQLLLVLDSKTGKIVGQAPIGKGVDAAVYDAGKHAVFVSCGDGTVTVVATDKAPQVLETIKTAPGSRTLAVDTKTHRLFLPTAQFQKPAAGGGEGRRRKMIPGTFELMVFEP